MSFKWIGSAFLCSVVALACGGGDGGGGGSGVDGTVELLDITAGEAGDVCDYIVHLDEAPRTIDCGDGTTVEVGQTEAEAQADIADCTTDLQAVPTDCLATVGELEACFEAFADEAAAQTDQEICDDVQTTLPAECEIVIPCLGA